MNASSDLVIDLKDLAIRYGRRTVLDGASLQVPRGAVFALLGRNGAGKSSIIRCVLGLQRASAGQLRVLGRDPWHERVAVLSRTGVVPETPDAPVDLRVADVIRLTSRLHVRWDGAAVTAACGRFALPLSSKIRDLSRGQRTAVMIALAFGHQPDLFILDDPTLGLDAVARGLLIADLVREIADRDVTALIATHDLAAFEGARRSLRHRHDG
jgi:ABC-2 type transport system ATP-binding protein